MEYGPSCGINDMALDLAPTQLSQADHTGA